MCCGKSSPNISIPPDQLKIIKAIKENTNSSNSVTKSNRNRPGMIAKQCPVCATKTIANVCPICYYKF
jgi:hypothetical protein